MQEYLNIVGPMRLARKSPVQGRAFYGALSFVSDSGVKFFFWVYLLFLVAVAGTATNPADPDLWHRLAVGEFLCKTGHFPPGDAFSYLANYREVPDHEWGSAVLFYSLYQLGGLNIFVGLKLLTLAVTLVLLVSAGMQNRRTTPLLASFYVGVLWALLPSFQSTVRCMVFTNLLFALWLYWFQRERHGRPVPTLFYVATMVVWANLHGGFVIGLVWLLLLVLVEGFRRGAWEKWAWRLGLCSLATLVNPFGWQLWKATGRALMVTREGFDEWAPVSWIAGPLDYPGYKILFLTVLVLLAIHIHRRGWKQMDRVEVVLLGLFMALSLISARHTSLFAAVAGALVPGLFPGLRAPSGSLHPGRRLGAMAVSSALILVPLYAALLVIPGEGGQIHRTSNSCPVGAVAYLQRQKVRGNLLVSFNYGSYALWELRGKMRVSMDGRYDLVYRPETYRRVEQFFLGAGDWQSLLIAPKPDAVLVSLGDPVYSKLKIQPGWNEIYHDRNDAVFQNSL